MRKPMALITTELADRVLPDLVPQAAAPFPTQTSANDAELWLRSVKVVAPVTSTVQLVLC